MTHKGEPNPEDMKLTWPQRIVKSMMTGSLMLVGGIVLILLSPIFSIKAILTAKRTDWNATKTWLEDMSNKMEDMGNPDSDEDWKKDHDNQYGS